MHYSSKCTKQKKLRDFEIERILFLDSVPCGVGGYYSSLIQYIYSLNPN
jgi:hypothetical protein